MTLPVASPAELSLSQSLSDYLIQRIQSSGPLSFADYMNEVLYHPQWGYYRNGLQKFGVHGDFITAPEISPLFSYTLARHIFQRMEEFSGPFTLLEIGPGQGTLMADCLYELDRLGTTPDTIYLLELSSELRQRQENNLKLKVPQLMHKISWLNALPTEPFSGFILGNEVLDAMPVHLFHTENNILYERCVGFETASIHELSSCSFGWVNTPNTDLEVALRKDNIPLEALHDYSSEINLNLAPFMQSLSDILAWGEVCLIDYGWDAAEYYHPQRNMGTLMCHYRHHAHPEPFFYPGLCDITAHVNFSAVAKHAHEAGFNIETYTSQSKFLLGAGILEIARDYGMDSPSNLQAIKKLTLEHEMGELFKIISLSKGHLEPSKGYQASLLYRL